VLNNMGVIYSRRGEFDRAVRVFEEALGVDPNQSGVLVNVARVYYRLGDYPTAWSYVMRAERLGGAVPGRLRADLERVMTRPGTP
jgi:Flp pilus assembly protein TadD